MKVCGEVLEQKLTAPRGRILTTFVRFMYKTWKQRAGGVDKRMAWLTVIVCRPQLNKKGLHVMCDIKARELLKTLRFPRFPHLVGQNLPFHQSVHTTYVREMRNKVKQVNKVNTRFCKQWHNKRERKHISSVLLAHVNEHILYVLIIV